MSLLDFHSHPLISFDEKDQIMLDKIVVQREAIHGPRIGDFIKFKSGEIERFSHKWPEGIQTSKGGGFFLMPSGDASFSGGLNPTVPLENIMPTDEVMLGLFWFFHHGLWGAGRGVYFKIPCRVFVTDADYNGFLS